MTLNLDRYHASLPYPEVRRVRRDPELAARLMEGYCGEISELTTVLQYAYHSLRCKKRFGEVSQTMRGIFYVETMHLEFVGECVAKLGGRPEYVLALREKTVDWQSSLVNYEETADRMLLADLEGERKAVAYYEETAALTDQADIAKLLLRLAEDEKLHVRMLSELYGRAFQR